MKTLSSLFRYLSAALLAAALMAVNSCQFDDSKIWDSITDLEQRIEKLEKISQEVQTDLESLKTIISKLQESITVDSITEEENGYTITFSDGSSISISNGEDGYTPPTITIVEEDGNFWWAYKYPDGTTEFLLDGDGNKIPATVSAPSVRINPETNHWEISSDGGKTWTDTGVSAAGSGDSLFKDISYDDEYIYITLWDGQTITIARTGETSVEFAENGPLYFQNGETKEISFTAKGYETITVNKPDGWKARISGDKIQITAPVAENTYAETEGKVTLIIVSSNGQGAMAEIEVRIGEAPAVKAEIGDIYYSDGTWSKDIDNSKTAVGVIFWIGDVTADDPDLKNDHPECTNGLVISIKEGIGPWQYNWDTFDGMVGDWIASNTSHITPTMKPSNENFNKKVGYSLSMGLRAFNNAEGHSEYPVEAIQTIDNTDLEAPAQSSGWYLPSPKELSLLCSGEVEGSIWDIVSDTDIRDMINASLAKIEGADQLVTYGYWTSAEYSLSNPYYVFFNDGAAYNDFRKSYEANMRIRGVLAF